VVAGTLFIILVVPRMLRAIRLAVFTLWYPPTDRTR
jgi:hypothetical protein